MSLHDLISEAKKWSKKEQIEFCDIISRNVTLAIRSINLYLDKSDAEKLEAMKWVNEFHHRIQNLRLQIDQKQSTEDLIELIGKHAKSYAEINEVAKGEIAGILNLSHEMTRRKLKKKFNND